MHLTGQDQLPAKVANVSRDELKKYGQCKRVGNYLLSKTVGEGSFAKVKEAFHILTGEKVAIKIIDKNRARKDRYVSKNMRREARLLQMIRHPHIVQLLEIVETSQCYYLVFEFADGGDLMDYICKRRKLEEDEVRKFIRQIISAVEYLHRLGIIHRDLKVENLLLDANKNIKIIDFGLSNTIYSPDPTNENHCSTQCGSPAYAAPELLVRKDYGPQIDVWSIGVNLYAMLTGRLPYTVEPFNISTLYNKMLRKQMNVIPEYLSEGCKDFIHQLLNPNPKERLNILEAAQHSWITDDRRDPLFLTVCPNYLCEEDLEDHILDHVEGRLKLNSDEVIRDVIQNRATKNSCVYHLMVRRLERYKREYQDLITMPPAVDDTLTSGKVPSQQNGIVQDQRSPAKTHIIENPFKTIKVALIRQKKASKTGEKSKSVTIKTPPTSSQVSNSSPRVESTNKPKLCPVKRVALVKVSPARRSFRGLTSSSRNLANSPKPSRRFFEGLQHRRKSPRVRRRHAEPDDSVSSVGSTSRQRNSFYGKKSTRNVVRKSSASKQSPGDRNSKNTENLEMTCAGEHPGEKSMEEIVPMETAAAEEETLETVTHFYADKGVVLKRDPTGNDEIKTDLTTDQDAIQHLVFHSSGKETVENVRDIQEPGGHDRVSVEVIKEGFTEDGKPNIQVVNAKISSVPTRRGVERLEPISPRSLNSSGTPTQHTPDKTSPQSDPLSPRKQEEKPMSPNRAPTTSSTVPISTTPDKVPPQKDLSAQRKSDEKLSNPNRVSRNCSDTPTSQCTTSDKDKSKKDSSSSKKHEERHSTQITLVSRKSSLGKPTSEHTPNEDLPTKDPSSLRQPEEKPTSQHTPSKGQKDPFLPRKPEDKPAITKASSLNSSTKPTSQNTPNKDQSRKDPSLSRKPEEKLSTPTQDRSSPKKPEEKPAITKQSSLNSSNKSTSQHTSNKDQPRKDPSLSRKPEQKLSTPIQDRSSPKKPEENPAIIKPSSSDRPTSEHTLNKDQPKKDRPSLRKPETKPITRNRVTSNSIQHTSLKDPLLQKDPPLQKDPSSPPKHEEDPVTSNRRSSLNQSKIPVPAGKSSPGFQSPLSSTRLASRTQSLSSANTRPLRTASRTKVSTLTDKYTKCFSVVAVNEPSATSELGGTRKSSAIESSLKTEKIGRLGEKNAAETQPDAKASIKASIRLQRIGNGVAGNKSQEHRRLSHDSSERKNSRVNGLTSTSKEEKKDDEITKKTDNNAIPNGKLPNVGESSTQPEPLKAKEPRQTQPWAGDERRKISNYRKTSDANQMNATIRREIRTASTFRPSS